MGVFSAFKTVSDKIGMVTTIGGLLLIPFICAAAGSAMAAGAAAQAATGVGAATNGGVLTSFWSLLVTNPLTGEMGLGAGATNIVNGAAGLAMSGFNMAASGMSAAASGGSITAAISTAWSAPAVSIF